jgi:hypothetical protein
VRLHSVRTQAEDLDIPEPGKGVVELRRLNGSSARVVLWIAEHYEPTPGQVLLAPDSPVLVGKLKLGKLRTF